MPVTPPKVEAPALVVGGIEHEREGHLERRRYFEWVEHELERRLDPSDHRADPEARGHFVIGQAADNVDTASREPDFLFGLAQRGLHAILVALLDSSAWKADLTRMIVEMFGALGQEHADAAVAMHNRHQNRGEHHWRIGRELDQMMIVRVRIPGRASEASGERCAGQ